MSIKFEPLVGGDITRELSPPPLSLAVLIAAGFGAYTGCFGVSEPGDDGATAAADRNVSHGSQTLRG
jgi:hypothetical protein